MNLKNKIKIKINNYLHKINLKLNKSNQILKQIVKLRATNLQVIKVVKVIKMARKIRSLNLIQSIKTLSKKKNRANQVKVMKMIVVKVLTAQHNKKQI